MKPTTTLLPLLASSVAAAAAEPSSCLQNTYPALTDIPQPGPRDEDIYMPLIDYGSDQVASCIKDGSVPRDSCGLDNTSLVCGFSTAGPSTAQSAWTSLIREAADWWTASGEQIRSLRSECPDSWTKQALEGSPYAEAPMEVALVFAQCWASAQGETLSPTPELGAKATGAGGSAALLPGGSTSVSSGPAPTATETVKSEEGDEEGGAGGLRAWGVGVVGFVAVAVAVGM